MSKHSCLDIMKYDRNTDHINTTKESGCCKTDIYRAASIAEGYNVKDKISSFNYTDFSDQK